MIEELKQVREELAKINAQVYLMGPGNTALVAEKALAILDRLIAAQPADDSHLAAEVERLRKLLAEAERYVDSIACPSDCWAHSISGPNPLVGPPNTPFCHNEERGRECGKQARNLLTRLRAELSGENRGGE